MQKVEIENVQISMLIAFFDIFSLKFSIPGGKSKSVVLNAPVQLGDLESLVEKIKPAVIDESEFENRENYWCIFGIFSRSESQCTEHKFRC